MELRHALQSIGSIADLPGLITALGHSAKWEPVPRFAWNKPGSRTFDLTLVGQTAGLPWFGIHSSQAQRDAVLLARRIASRGKLAVVLALDSQTRQLGVSVAFGRAPGLQVNLNSPDAESVASLARLAGTAEGGTLAFAARAADALSTEPVGRRFFREFKGTLDRMTAALPEPMPRADRHGIVLLQLTRVLFLYFIQSKGWLGQRDRFLAEEVDRCLSGGHRVHRDFLRPLFFGTLNQPRSERGRTARQFGTIPFLNGGLFEPHALERRYRADIPNPLWCDAFDRLFERFHFTISEGDKPGSVAPDMLGRVFEGVMDPEDRRASGTFYTPAALVQRLVDAALTVVLAIRMRCTEQEAERRLIEQDPVAAGVLDGITVLDPAVGSGAFLLGTLHRLAATAEPSRHAERKRRVLQQSLFGVDRNAAAVRLAELRLWLSVIADDPTGSAHAVHPLPNLDCLIRQGDSLFDPGGLDLLSAASHQDRGLVAEMSQVRKQVISATGSRKRSWVRRLRRLEAQALGNSLSYAEEQRRGVIAGYLQLARAPDLFGGQRGLDRELRAGLNQERTALRRLRQARRQLSRHDEIPWFHYRSAFADVFAQGGFDLVIGNPPWLRSEAIPPDTRRQIAARYRWWRSRGGCYGNSPDLAIAFLERAFELARPQGVVAMLVPAKIATAGYGAGARHALASSTTLHLLANVTGAREATFDAMVYPLALVAGNSPPPSNQLTRTDLCYDTADCVIQRELRGGTPWILKHAGIHAVLGELEQQHPRLAENLTCHLGVKTGLNQVFLEPSGDIEPELLRWALRGRDVGPFRCRPKLRLLWTHDIRGNPLSRLPPRALAFLGPYADALRRRRDFRQGPFWTLFRTVPAVARHRVVWPDLSRQLKAAALTSRAETEWIPLNTCYVAPVATVLQARALAGWLNSTWIRAVAMLGAVPAANGFFRFNSGVVKALPLPPAALRDQDLAQLALDGQAGKLVAGELDALVAGHLALSERAQKALRGALDSCSIDHR
jgi:hypothetical protein